MHPSFLIPLELGVGLFVLDWLRHLCRVRTQSARRRSSITLEGNVWIVTTASLPWRTGTAVNPTLRAAHLSKDPRRRVTLLVPWLPPEDQALLFPPGLVCASREAQAKYIAAWAAEYAGASDFTVKFYAARYYPKARCIFAAEDITRLIPRHEVDCVLLEEPEHLNWYQGSRRWSTSFHAVVGVIHTNYSAHAAAAPGGLLGLAAVGIASRIVCRVHCHKVVKLSELARSLTRSVTCNVHGVSSRFLDVGAEVAEQRVALDKGAYFLGKALWDKGHAALMDLLEAAGDAAGGQRTPVDVYGVGEDLPAIQAEAGRRRVALAFKGLQDHVHPDLHGYRVFINPCTRDVIATATAEALAMGKWALLPAAPCNEFFTTFPNALVYSSPLQFAALLAHALETPPAPMSAADLRRLSWEAATERLLEAASISPGEWPRASELAVDDMLWLPYRLIALACKGIMGGWLGWPQRLEGTRGARRLEGRRQRSRRRRGGGGGDAEARQHDDRGVALGE